MIVVRQLLQHLKPNFKVIVILFVLILLLQHLKPNFKVIVILFVLILLQHLKPNFKVIELNLILIIIVKQWVYYHCYHRVILKLSGNQRLLLNFKSI